MRTFRSDQDRRDPKPFKIDYEMKVVEKVETTGPDGELVYEERFTGEYTREERVFHVRPGQLSGGMTMAINDLDPDDPMSGIRQNKAIREAIDVSVVEVDDFWALLNDPRAQIKTYVLSEVLSWFVELSSARPTPPPRR